MTELRPVVVFPAAHRRGGVERVAWESLRYLGKRYPTTFVGHRLDDADQLTVDRVIPKEPAWALGSLRPLGFRVAASRCLPREPGAFTISHGVNAPPGDVYYVHSVHRGWLAAGRAVRYRGVEIPNRARYALPRHQVLLGLEHDYFRRHHPRAIVVVSPETAEDLERFYGIPASSVHIVPNGFDPEQCNPRRRLALRADRRAELGIGEDAVVLLFLANELHRKGFDVLLEAVARVPDDRLEVHVVGRTPLDAYRSRIDTLGLTRRVRFHGPTDDVGLAHAFADVFVLPTQYETFAIAVLEALASGLPVILTTGVPGAGARVRDDENGLLLDDASDPIQLAMLLETALDPARRASWALAAPLSVPDLEWDAVLERFDAVLERVS